MLSLLTPLVPRSLAVHRQGADSSSWEDGWLFAYKSIISSAGLISSLEMFLFSSSTNSATRLLVGHLPDDREQAKVELPAAVDKKRATKA